jgi:hypothetical protein
MLQSRTPVQSLVLRLTLPLGLLLGGCAHEPLPYSPNYSRVTLADPALAPVKTAGVHKGYDAAPVAAARTVMVPDACITPDVTEQPVYLPSGCANALNLQAMVERKKDLVRGRKPGPATAAPAVRAAERYLYGGTEWERRASRIEATREQTTVVVPSLPQGTRPDAR